MKLDLATFDATKLTLLEVMDMAEKAGVEPENLASLLSRPKFDPSKARMLYALGWVIARRADPGLTFVEVLTWHMEVIGTMDEKPKSGRDKAVVGAAILAGVSPREAEKLSLGELAVYRENRATRRRRGRKR